MHAKDAQSLHAYLQQKRDELSGGREGNPGETFEIQSVQPLCEDAVAVVWHKSSGKFALMVCLLTNQQSSKPYWWNFFPTDSQALALGLDRLYQHVERNNFTVNFK